MSSADVTSTDATSTGTTTNTTLPTQYAPRMVLRVPGSTVVVIKSGELLELRRGDVSWASLTDRRVFSNTEEWLNAVGQNGAVIDTTGSGSKTVAAPELTADEKRVRAIAKLYKYQLVTSCTKIYNDVVANPNMFIGKSSDFYVSDDGCAFMPFRIRNPRTILFLRTGDDTYEPLRFGRDGYGKNKKFYIMRNMPDGRKVAGRTFESVGLAPDVAVYGFNNLAVLQKISNLNV
jgi:hypothetical protein